ncbi:MAG: RNA polymerase-binding protein DksA [Anaeromyxobacter sp. RBG_16_69_14]|nr:MAG: RNA polymerase-binding protein DksA [Anaeromyxobacter sp. RBG_16_69_14]
MRKQELTRFRKELEAQLAEISHHGVATMQDMVDGGEELPDPNDRASRESEIESELRLRDRDRKLIPKIHLALARIRAGTFGLCTTCGQPIGAARLRARPVTDLCIDCKREAERLER